MSGFITALEVLAIFGALLGLGAMCCGGGHGGDDGGDGGLRCAGDGDIRRRIES